MRYLLILLFTLFAQQAIADSDSGRAGKLYDQVRCPTCVSQSVKESDTIASENIREFIDRRISEGKSDDEILAMLRSYYGDEIVLKPKFSSHTILLWGVPLSVLAFGFISIFKRGVRRID